MAPALCLRASWSSFSLTTRATCVVKSSQGKSQCIFPECSHERMNERVFMSCYGLHRESIRCGWNSSVPISCPVLQVIAQRGKALVTGFINKHLIVQPETRKQPETQSGQLFPFPHHVPVQPWAAHFTTHTHTHLSPRLHSYLGLSLKLFSTSIFPALWKNNKTAAVW